MEENAFSFLFEVDDKKVPSQVTGTMHVAIPADASKKELKQIQNVLQKSIAQELGLQDPEDIELVVQVLEQLISVRHFGFVSFLFLKHLQELRHALFP